MIIKFTIVLVIFSTIYVNLFSCHFIQDITDDGNNLFKEGKSKIETSLKEIAIIQKINNLSNVLGEDVLATVLNEERKQKDLYENIFNFFGKMYFEMKNALNIVFNYFS